MPLLVCAGSLRLIPLASILFWWHCIPHVLTKITQHKNTIPFPQVKKQAHGRAAETWQKKRRGNSSASVSSLKYPYFWWKYVLEMSIWKGNDIRMKLLAHFRGSFKKKTKNKLGQTPVLLAENYSNIFSALPVISDPITPEFGSKRWHSRGSESPPANHPLLLFWK